jgi:hypothetical protein
MTEFIAIQHALVPTPQPAALFCDKSYMTDIQKSEGILFCLLEKEDHNGRVDSTTPMAVTLFFPRSFKQCQMPFCCAEGGCFAVLAFALL